MKIKTVFSFYYNSLKFVSNQDGSKIRLNKIGTPYKINLYYKLNNNIFYYSIGSQIALNQGQSVQFYNRNSNLSKDQGNYYQFSITGNIKIQNSINSLINNSNNLSDYCFYNLFKDCTGLTSISQNLLFSNTLFSHCYDYMFNGCSNLSNITINFTDWNNGNSTKNWLVGVKSGINISIFKNLQLKYGNDYLPQNAIVNQMNYYLYNSLKFISNQDESKIILNKYGIPNEIKLYYKLNNNIFSYDIGLQLTLNKGQSIQLYNENNNFSKDQENYYQFSITGNIKIQNSINSLINNSDLSDYCFYNLFKDCTGLTSIPQNLLPSTTLAQYCYDYMFYGCSKLSNITINFIDWNEGNSTSNWLIGVKSGINVNISKDLQMKYGNNYLPQDSLISLYDYEFPQNSLKFISNQNGSKIILNKIGSPDEINLYYKLNNIQNNSSSSQQSNIFYYYNIGAQITLNNGQSVQFYNRNNTFSKDYNNYYQFSITGNIKIQGSIKSLINNSDLSDYCFYKLFKDCEGLTSLSQNLLFATTLSLSCYRNMFYGCSKLSNITIKFNNWNNGNSTQDWLYSVKSGINVNISKDLQIKYGNSYLPQDSIISIYDYEFPQNSLKFVSNQDGSKIILNKIGAPNEIKLYYKLNNNTYLYKIGIQLELNQGQSVQFYNRNNNFSKDWENYYQFSITGNVKIQNSINSLINNSDLSDYCFYSLFKDCKGLTSIPQNLLPSTTLANGCYDYMFYGCTGLTSIPSNLLPSTILVSNCYSNMFNGCNNLSNITINFTDWNGGNSTQNWLVGVKSGININISKDLQVKYGDNYLPNVSIISIYDYEFPQNSLKFVSNQYGSKIILNKIGSPDEINLFYKLNNNIFYYYKIGIQLELNQGQSVQFYNRNNNFSKDQGNYYQFSITGNVKIQNSINSLINNSDLSDYCFYSLFKDCKGLISIPSNLLPFTTLFSHCYDSMFYGCTGITFIPSNLLPATTLAGHCYSSMFNGCTGITNVPNLPATTLAQSCYDSMFRGCTWLTSIPQNLLPATTLYYRCYYYMFEGCTGITSIPQNLLPATILANDCYAYMFSGCTLLTSIPWNLLFAKILVNSCYYSMFSGCTGITSIPSNLLPSTILANDCYAYMFSGCTGITSIPQNLLPSTILVSNCYGSMFRGCTGLTSIPQNLLPATILANDCYAYMFNGCSNLSNITIKFNDWNNGNSTQCWLVGVKSGININIFKDLYVKYGNNYLPQDSIISFYDYEFPQNSLKFVSNQDGSKIILNKIRTPYKINLYYKLNNSMSSYKIGTQITLNNRQSVQFYNRNSYFSKDYNNYYQFNITGNIKIQNSINSLINNSDLSDYCFYNLFKDCTGLTSIPQNLLPSTTLANNCYDSMFYGCTNLTNAPNLLATTLVNDCYNYMFYRCSNLSNITINFIDWNGYNSTHCWLYGVKSGININISKNLQVKYDQYYRLPWYSRISIYDYEFPQNSLKFVSNQDGSKIILNKIGTPYKINLYYKLNNNTYLYKIGTQLALNQGQSVQFYNRNNTFSKDQGNYYQFSITGDVKIQNPINSLINNSDLRDYCFYNLFKDCTGLTSIPQNLLSFTTLVFHCYDYMFDECSNLSNITINFIDWNGGNSTHCWLYGVKSGININISKNLQVKYGNNYLPNDSIISIYDYEFPQNSLKFVSNQDDSKITLNKLGTPDEINLYYKLNNIQNDSSSSQQSNIFYYYKIGTQLTLNNGQSVQLYNSNSHFSKDYYNYYRFNITGNIKIQNSINSLINNRNKLSDYCFYNLFKDCEGLRSLPSNLLPATKLSEHCYGNMFKGCTGITSIPQNLLPSTILVSNCYSNMFNGCNNLSNITINFTDWNGGNSTQNWLVGVKSGININISKDLYVKYGNNYLPNVSIISIYDYEFPQNSLKFVSNQDGSKIILNKIGSPDEINLFYKLNNIQNNSSSSQQSNIFYYYKIGTQLTLNNGQSVQFYNRNNTFSKDYNNYYQFSITGNIKIQGSIKSLINNSDLSDYCFYKLFKDCTGLTSIPQNLLHATTLANYCYRYMFYGCTGITSIPQNLLPATTLAQYCYSSMFSGCTGITSIPQNLLLATTLAQYCYAYMFYGCTGITSIPQNLLLATTLAQYCYAYMFYGCTGITSIPQNLLPATKLANGCYSHMFYECKGITTAPNLPATKLASYCYYYMFYRCSKLSNIKVNFIDWNSSNESTQHWLSEVSSTGTFRCNVIPLPKRGFSYIPYGWLLICV